MRTFALSFLALFSFSLSFFSPVQPAFGIESAPSASIQSGWSWPLPPDPPRIRHELTLVAPQDLGVTKGFFARLWAFIAGDDSADRIVSPHSVVADGEGKVYITDWGIGRIHYFNIAKKEYEQFGRNSLGELVSPIGAALDGEGLLYVSDSIRRRVFVYRGTKNKRIIGDDELLRPTGVAINKKEKTLYVVDTTGHRVDVFDLEGKRLESFGRQGGGDGEFNYPTHIALDAAGNVYVMDTMNFRVQIFDKTGRFLSKFGGNGSAIGAFMKPKGIAVDSEGHIWVSDGMRNSVQVFDREGRLLLIWGSKGIERGEFDVPAGLYFDSKDRLYVADSYNFRVQIFQYLKQP
jgi:sugar lactone lactonase YvrE